MSEIPPNFQQCIDWLRSDDALTFEDGYHALRSHVRAHRDHLVRLLQTELSPEMRGRLVELLGETQDPSLAEVLHTQLETEHPQVIPWVLTALERVGHPQIADEYRKMHPEYD